MFTVIRVDNAQKEHCFDVACKLSEWLPDSTVYPMVNEMCCSEHSTRELKPAIYFDAKRVKLSKPEHDDSKDINTENMFSNLQKIRLAKLAHVGYRQVVVVTTDVTEGLERMADCMFVVDLASTSIKDTIKFIGKSIGGMQDKYTRMKAFMNLGTIRLLGSAGFTMPDGNKKYYNEDYKHFGMEAWTLGHEGAYTEFNKNKADFFDEYIDALLLNFSNGEDGMTPKSDKLMPQQRTMIYIEDLSSENMARIAHYMTTIDEKIIFQRLSPMLLSRSVFITDHIKDGGRYVIPLDSNAGLRKEDIEFIVDSVVDYEGTATLVLLTDSHALSTENYNKLKTFEIIRSSDTTVEAISKLVVKRLLDE